MGQGWDGGGMEGPTLAGVGMRAPPLALEGRRLAGGGKRWLAPIVSVLQGYGVFFSEQKNGANMLHINWN